MGIADDSQTVVGWAEMAEELRDSLPNYIDDDDGRRGWTWYGTAQRRKKLFAFVDGRLRQHCDHISDM